MLLVSSGNSSGILLVNSSFVQAMLERKHFEEQQRQLAGMHLRQQQQLQKQQTLLRQMQEQQASGGLASGPFLPRGEGKVRCSGQEGRDRLKEAKGTCSV